MVRSLLIGFGLIAGAFVVALLAGSPETPAGFQVAKWLLVLIAALFAAVIGVLLWLRGLAARVSVRLDLSRIPSGALPSIPVENLSSRSQEIVTAMRTALGRLPGFVFEYFARGRATRMTADLETFCRREGHEVVTVPIFASWMADTGSRAVSSAVLRRFDIGIGVAAFAYVIAICGIVACARTRVDPVDAPSSPESSTPDAGSLSG